MNAVAYVGKGRCVCTNSLQEYFSEQLAKIARLLAKDRELKEDFLQAGHDLVKTLNVIADNSIPLPEQVILRTRETLQWMEEYLDGKDQRFMLDSAQYKEFKTIYEDSAEALGLIALQSALVLQ